jgi:hypothetical protein
MGIGTTTLTEWHNRDLASGEVAAQQGYQQGHSHKITDRPPPSKGSQMTPVRPGHRLTQPVVQGMVKGGVFFTAFKVLSGI